MYMTIFESKKNRVQKVTVNYFPIIFAAVAGSNTQEPDDQDDDTEYNFWSDQPEDEKEEFRNDKAVKIPRESIRVCILWTDQFKFIQRERLTS